MIDEFGTNHPTDYGVHERTLEDTVADIMRQLERGGARIVFGMKTATVNIVSHR